MHWNPCGSTSRAVTTHTAGTAHQAGRGRSPVQRSRLGNMSAALEQSWCLVLDAMFDNMLYGSSGSNSTRTTAAVQTGRSPKNRQASEALTKRNPVLQHGPFLLFCAMQAYYAESADIRQGQQQQCRAMHAYISAVLACPSFVSSRCVLKNTPGLSPQRNPLFCRKTKTMPRRQATQIVTESPTSDCLAQTCHQAEAHILFSCRPKQPCPVPGTTARS
jgi:hypothetical protein